jgi:hypothetical protein
MASSRVIFTFTFYMYFHGTRINLISFAPITKVQSFLRRFWRKSQMLGSIMCGSLTPNFTQIGQEIWKVRIQIRYVLIQSAASIAADFHEAHNHLVHFCGNLLCRNLSTSGENSKQKQAEFHLCPEIKHGFHCAYFHESHNCWPALDVALLCRILQKSINESGKYGRISFTPFCKAQLATTEPIFTKFLPERQRFVKNSYTEFQGNPTDGLFAHTW